ncbi:hypothetical protein [Streptomyces sp. NPDC059814]|uniref:hypothetical protein n=1 Tax=unclassified Streptomyces TaxID=2593676 RepID=UPI003646D1F1
MMADRLESLTSETSESAEGPENLDTLDHLTLVGSRDALSSGYCDDGTADAITGIFAGVEAGKADATEALQQLQDLLEQIRHTPAGVDRISRMNAFVRTLGRADNLAAFLELMRATLKPGQPSNSTVDRSLASRAHCIYGWSGQTLVLASEVDDLDSTTAPETGVEEFMGYPLAEWHASIHIWQPNPEAEGFASTKRFEPNMIAEPPHSHPFSFVSYVSKGEMRQSVYEETPGVAPAGSTDRYGDVTLERVDGVWPPHPEYVPSHLRTAEERILLTQGESYFMTTNLVHDVEVDRTAAADRPTITLFLCSETTRIPKSYMMPSMADFHRDNPDLTDRAAPLDPEEWDAKLDATARYLRGESEHLRLGEVFECGSTYAFINV